MNYSTLSLGQTISCAKRPHSVRLGRCIWVSDCSLFSLYLGLRTLLPSTKMLHCVSCGCRVIELGAVEWVWVCGHNRSTAHIFDRRIFAFSACFPFVRRAGSTSIQTFSWGRWGRHFIVRKRTNRSASLHYISNLLLLPPPFPLHPPSITLCPATLFLLSSGHF